MSDYDEILPTIAIGLFVGIVFTIITFPISVPYLIYLHYKDSKEKESSTGLYTPRAIPQIVYAEPDPRFKFKKSNWKK